MRFVDIETLNLTRPVLESGPSTEGLPMHEADPAHLGHLIRTVEAIATALILASGQELPDPLRLRRAAVRQAYGLLRSQPSDPLLAGPTAR